MKAKISLNEELLNIKTLMGILNEDMPTQQQQPQNTNNSSNALDTIKNIAQSNGFNFVPFNGVSQQIQQVINSKKTIKELLGNNKGILFFIAGNNPQDDEFVLLLSTPELNSSVFQKIRTSLKASQTSSLPFQKSDGTINLNTISIYN